MDSDAVAVAVTGAFERLGKLDLEIVEVSETADVEVLVTERATCVFDGEINKVGDAVDIDVTELVTSADALGVKGVDVEVAVIDGVLELVGDREKFPTAAAFGSICANSNDGRRYTLPPHGIKQRGTAGFPYLLNEKGEIHVINKK